MFAVRKNIIVMVMNYAKFKTVNLTDIVCPLTLGDEIKGITQGFDIVKPKPHLRHVGIFKGCLSSL